MRRLLLLVAFATAYAVVAQNPSYQLDPQWRPPASAVSRPNPLAGKPETAAGGKKLFLRHCAVCHGNSGKGIAEKHSADFSLALVQEQPDGALFWKMTNGNAGKGMPSFSGLPELQRWQMVLYIRTLRTTGPAAADPVK